MIYINQKILKVIKMKIRKPKCPMCGAIFDTKFELAEHGKTH